MYEIIFLFILAIIWVIFAVIQDLRTREIANWLNFSLIVFALGFRFFYSLFNEDFNFFYQGVIGLGIFYVLGNFFYYSHIFAGGDAKLMISLGPVIPFFGKFLDNLSFSVLFLFLFLITGALYGLIWSFFLSTKNFKKFEKEFYKQFSKRKSLFVLMSLIGFVFVVLGFFKNVFFLLGVFLFVFIIIYNYAKAVDESCMVRKIKPSMLREGDWLYKDLKLGRKIIKANWEGLTKEQIKLIQKKNKSVLIKQGVPFSPVFLISILVLFYFWKINVRGVLF